MQLPNTMFFFLIALVFISCKKEAANPLPVSNAGADVKLSYPVTNIVLDGSASSAPGGTITRYEWRYIYGPSYGSFLNSLSAKAVFQKGPSLQSLGAGTYTFELTVTDNKGQQAKDTVQATVSLSGQEFVFDNLVWEDFDDVDYGWKHVLVLSPRLPEFFHPASIYRLLPNTESVLEVYVKLENTSVWIQAKPMLSTASADNFYYVEDEHLVVENHPPNLPPNTGLVGKKVSIKLKFL